MKLVFSSIILYASFMLTSCSGTRPLDIGISNNSLKACPEKPNCVSSFASTEGHKIEALTLDPKDKASLGKVKAAAQSLGNGVLVSETDEYLYYEFTSTIMRYVDDVEFYFPKGGTMVHFRSASRLGHSDLGVNRERMEAIRSKLK